MDKDYVKMDYDEYASYFMFVGLFTLLLYIFTGYAVIPVYIIYCFVAIPIFYNLFFIYLLILDECYVLNKFYMKLKKDMKKKVKKDTKK